MVVGGGAAIYRTEELNWPDGAVDAGYVTDEELAQLYRGARSVVFVSKAEGFGLPIVEAAAAGAREPAAVRHRSVPLDLRRTRPLRRPLLDGRHP